LPRPVAFAVAIVVLALAGIPARGVGNPAANMDELQAQLSACLQTFHAPEGASIDVSFSVKRDGHFFGQPRAVWFGPKDMQDRAQILAEFLAAFDACMPLDLSPLMAALIPGKIFSLHYKAMASGADIMVRPKRGRH
jgi:hypothetical protein